MMFAVTRGPPRCFDFTLGKSHVTISYYMTCHMSCHMTCQDCWFQVGGSLGGDTLSVPFVHHCCCLVPAVKGSSVWTLARCLSRPVRTSGTSRCDLYLPAGLTAATLQDGPALMRSRYSLQDTQTRLKPSPGTHSRACCSRNDDIIVFWCDNRSKLVRPTV